VNIAKSVLKEQLSEDFLLKSKYEQIQIRKRMAKIVNESRSDAKLEYCYCCGKSAGSFCNSHSVPAFSLRNIAVNGMLYHSNSFVELSYMDLEKGINSSGTFKLICRDCDSTLFSAYENPENYGKILAPRLIAQIAMKNYLKNISKRHIEVCLYNKLLNIGLTESAHDAKQVVHELDLKEYIY
jgi:hypothetical protein